MATMTEIEPVRTHTRIRVERHSVSSSRRLRSFSQTTTTSPTATLNQKALTVIQDLRYSLTTIPRPKSLAPNEVLLRTHTIGLNPIDWKTVSYNFCMPSLPWINGRECSAIIEETGSAVRSLKKGQKVWTSTYYKDRRAGCFQDLVVVPEHTVVDVPRGVDMGKAATLGVAGLTAGMVLWHWFGVGMGRPTVDKTAFVLIWGGSTITGQYAIQMAHLAGLRVITVASQRSMERLLELGCNHIITRDGKSLQDIATEVRSIGQDNIILGMDLVGAKTAALCMECLSTGRPAKFASLAAPSPALDLPANVEMMNVEMKRFVLDPTSRKYATHLSELVQQGSVKCPDMMVLSGGLSTVEAGLEMLKKGENDGKKIVVRM